MSKRVTVIDIGSNSVRMVVYEKTSRFSFHILHEEKSKVRISENAYKNGANLQEVPMQRTFDALKDFLSISNSFKSRKILCVATSALRDAPNKKEFIHKVRDRLKLNIKIVDGQKEAYLGAIACANLLPEQNSALTIDIGGGSTEFALINNKDISNTLSLKLGTVRIKELFLDRDNVEDAINYIDEQLESIADFNPSTLVGIGGTFRAISNAIMKNSDYPLDKLHAYEYSQEILEDFISQILDAKDNNALKELGIANNRFDVIKSGTLILQRVLKKLSIKNIITSGVGVREGVYLSDLLRNSKHKFPHNYNTSVKYLIDSYIQEKNYSNQLNTIAKKLFDLTTGFFSLDKKYRYEFALAAKLYPAGSSVHFFSKNKHSYYLIQTALEYGFTHSEIVLIATLNKYATKKLPSESHKQKYQSLLPDSRSLDTLSNLFSLSIALLAHKPRDIDFDLEFVDGVLSVISKERLYLAQEAVKKLSFDGDFRVQF
ncbi:MAG: Ppx/GppA phosphatase family protein [Campylobacterota bacterium]|nr:Ppx/GppA phosphatase family protein [Campylobacterota bacterium]